MAKIRVSDGYRDAMCRRLKDARQAAGFTQASFAEKLGLDEKTYAKYESRSLLPHEFIGIVCRLLDLDMYFLLDGHGRDAVRPKPRKVN
jgi:transcriptional regulator with XRE-family HTH domain